MVSEKDENLEEFDFFEDYGEVGGVFDRYLRPAGAHGDKDAIEDLQAECVTVPMHGISAPDGMAVPNPTFDGMAILNSSATVSVHNLVCLAGPCKHYTEAVVQEGGLRRVIRRCNRIVTWAEQLRLDDVNVLGCSCHETEVDIPESVRNRINLGRRYVRLMNEKACSITGHSLGVCHEASCKYYAVMVLGNYEDSGEGLTPKVERWCIKLGGAARPYKLDPNSPVLGCSAVVPGYPNDAIDRSESNLEEMRNKLAGKGDE